MGIKHIAGSVTDICPKRCHKTVNKMNSSTSVDFLSAVIEEQLYTYDDNMFFELPTPPSSPRQGDDDGEFDIETIMPFELFDFDSENLLLFDEDCAAEVLKEVGMSFPEWPPDTSLQSNLIQDIMWSAPARIDNSQVSSYRLRCNSCSDPFNTTCVAPDEVFPMDTNIGDVISQTRVHSLGIETPSDSEEEIDVVTVEKHLHVTVSPNIKRECYTSDESENEPSQSHDSKTVSLTISSKPNVSAHSVNKCTTLKQRVHCPTDVHNYSLPVTSLKRVHSYPDSPVTDKSKKLKRDTSIPSDLKKVAQKLKSSVGSFINNSSDSDELCDGGKRTQHNVLERKRRTDLKNSFFHLRDSVPELEGHERAPKVVILRKASQYIHKLVDEQKRQEKEIELLKIKKDKLRRHFSRLKEY